MIYGLHMSCHTARQRDGFAQRGRGCGGWPVRDARGRSHKNSHLFLRPVTHPAAASLELGGADLRDVPVCRAPRSITVPAIPPRWLPTRRVSAVSPVPAVPFGRGCAVPPLVAVSGVAACGRHARLRGSPGGTDQKCGIVKFAARRSRADDVLRLVNASAFSGTPAATTRLAACATRHMDGCI